MIIVEVGGGLGNQMFCYMLYLALKERRDDVKISRYIFDHFTPGPLHARKCFLDKLFVASSLEWQAMSKC